jgi:hypothetical protein
VEDSIRIYSTQESEINVRLEVRNVIGGVGISAVRPPERSLPVAVRFTEGWVNRMKFVVVQWIVDLSTCTVFYSDCNLLKRNNLVRRDGVACPIPERLAKIIGGLLPVRCVDSISRSDFLGQSLQNLLIEQLLRQSQARSKDVEKTS